MDGVLAHMGVRRGAYRVVVGKPDGKSTVGGPRHRWEDNSELDLQEVGWGGINLLALELFFFNFSTSCI